MSDFDDFDDKNLFSDTFDLLEDIKAAGYDLKKSKFFNTPIEKIFDSPFFTRNRNRARGESSTRRFPTFSSNSSKKSTSTTESSETDSGDELFHSRAFRRSDSTYSTSSHDTTSSGETASDASSTRSNPRKVNVTRQIPVQHFVTSSKNYQPGIPKKSENEVLKDERHSMPYKLYSHQENEANERTQAMSSKTEIPVSERDGVSRFPSPLSKSTELQHKPEASASQRDRKLNPPELCSVTRYGQSKSLPDVLKTDRMAVPPNVPKVGCEKGEQPSWDERQGRIEGALKWLRAELGLLRAQDKVLLSQLKRCQDTIEVIKKQRSEEIDEEGEEEEEHWEDWEIAEFDRRCREGEIIDDLSPSCTKKAMDISSNMNEVKS